MLWGQDRDMGEGPGPRTTHRTTITKTASPDLPGDWAGAYLSVETKDYPEELSVNFEVSAGYNSQSTFQDVLSSERSKTDWLGYDNSYRDHSHTDFVRTVENPTTYQQLVALGLGPYYASMGVTGENWNSNSDTYFRLGLVQLGLLDPALIYDETAYQQARTAYLTGNYTSDAFKIINAAVPDYGKSFPNNWNTIHKNAPLDFSQGLSVGNQVNFFGKPLGFLVGYRYGNSTRYDQNSSAKRVRYDGQTESVVTSENSIETNGWSALMNLAYKFSPNHSVSLLFMPNFTGINKAQDALDATDSSRFVITKSQFYEQRRQLVYQLKTEHYFPSHRIRSELNASYTRGRSSVPDFKNLQYWKDARVNTYQIGGEIGNGIHRYFRYLSDNLLDSRLSFEIPLGDSAGLARKFKLGGAYQRVDRKSDQYDYALNTSDLSNLTLRDNDITTYFDLSNFDIRSDENNGIPYSTINEYYDESGSPANHTFGNSQVSAGFLMVDYALTKRLRFSGGLRMEVADIYTDVAEYDSLHYRKDDPRRQYSSTYPIVNPGILHDLSWLPSANLIWKVRTDEQAPVNLRLNYSGTTARPGIRELSDVALLDYEYREFVFGNSDLKPVRISNYDIRLESYFKSGDNISLSLFYKKFKDHIELVKSVGLTWQNVDKSQVAGLELEGKKIFLKNFEAGANVALIWSQTKYVRNRTDISEGVKKYIPIDTLTRTMFGQAPYVVNCILTWHARKAGADLTFSYNVQGERLVITSANPDIPDVYEKPRNLLDVRVNKNLGKHFSVNVTLRDLFNAPVKRIYKNWGTVYDEYHYGTSYVLGISYKL